MAEPSSDLSMSPVLGSRGKLTWGHSVLDVFLLCCIAKTGSMPVDEGELKGVSWWKRSSAEARSL